MENKQNFEAKLNQLNELVNKLQDNTISFDESLVLYEKAVKLSDELKKELDQAITKITEFDSKEEN
jgi:exodeoxyribonuclease VII small subunit